MIKLKYRVSNASTSAPNINIRCIIPDVIFDSQSTVNAVQEELEEIVGIFNTYYAYSDITSAEFTKDDYNAGNIVVDNDIYPLKMGTICLFFNRCKMTKAVRYFLLSKFFNILRKLNVVSAAYKCCIYRSSLGCFVIDENILVEVTNSSLIDCFINYGRTEITLEDSTANFITYYPLSAKSESIFKDAIFVHRALTDNTTYDRDIKEVILDLQTQIKLKPSTYVLYTSTKEVAYFNYAPLLRCKNSEICVYSILFKVAASFKVSESWKSFKCNYLKQLTTKSDLINFIRIPDNYYMFDYLLSRADNSVCGCQYNESVRQAPTVIRGLL